METRHNYTARKPTRTPRRAHRGGLGAVMLVLMGLAGMAHAVDHETKAVSSVSIIADQVVESPTWQDGYTLIEGIDDYGYGLIETTPNEEVSGETPARFEDWVLIAER